MINPIYAIIVLMLFAPTLWAQDVASWQTSVTASGSLSQYANSDTKNSLLSYDAVVSRSHQDQFDFTLALGQSNVKFIAANNYSDTHFALSAARHAYVDLLKGKVSTRVIAYRLDTNSTYDTNIAGASLALLSYSRKLYVDATYTQSWYLTSLTGVNGFSVQQWSSSLEFGLFSPRVWLSLQPYWMRGQDLNARTSLLSEVTLSVQSSRLLPQRYVLGAMAGQQQYAVNHRQLAVFNHADVMRQGAWLRMHWYVTDYFSFEAGAGSYWFDAQTGTGSNYQQNYFNGLLTVQW